MSQEFVERPFLSSLHSSVCMSLCVFSFDCTDLVPTMYHCKKKQHTSLSLGMVERLREFSADFLRVNGVDVPLLKRVQEVWDGQGLVRTTGADAGETHTSNGWIISGWNEVIFDSTRVGHREGRMDACDRTATSEKRDQILQLPKRRRSLRSTGPTSDAGDNTKMDLTD